jgi:hypothetical protein
MPWMTAKDGSQSFRAPVHTFSVLILAGTQPIVAPVNFTAAVFTATEYV